MLLTDFTTFEASSTTFLAQSILDQVELVNSVTQFAIFDTSSTIFFVCSTLVFASLY
jgi:hypothetical protein